MGLTMTMREANLWGLQLVGMVVDVRSGGIERSWCCNNPWRFASTPFSANFLRAESTPKKKFQNKKRESLGRKCKGTITSCPWIIGVVAICSLKNRSFRNWPLEIRFILTPDVDSRPNSTLESQPCALA